MIWVSSSVDYILFFFFINFSFSLLIAFSWFAFFEYLIAIANMLFHFTIIWDFPFQYMLVVQGPRAKLEEIFRKSLAKLD